MGTWVLFQVINRPEYRTAHFHSVPKVGMSGDITPLPLYAFVTCGGTTFHFALLQYFIRLRTDFIKALMVCRRVKGNGMRKDIETEGEKQKSLLH